MLTDLLLYYAYMEQELETLRENLCLSRIIPYNLFKFIDSLSGNPKGYLTTNDIDKLFQLLKVPCNKNSVFVANYNQSQDGKLVYSEFLKSILPLTNQRLREQISMENPRTDIDVHEDILLKFVKLVESEVKLTLQAEQFKSKQNTFHLVSNGEFVTIHDLFEYFRREHIDASQQELSLIFNRIDLLCDGRIDQNEWKIYTQQRDFTSAKENIKIINPRNSNLYQKDLTMSNLLSQCKQGYYQSRPPLSQQSTPSKYLKHKTDVRAQMSFQSNQRSYSSNKKTNVQRQLQTPPTRYETPVQARIPSGKQDPVLFFLNFFIDVLELEIKLERQKHTLCNQDGFSLFSCFQSLDKSQKGYLSNNDLRNYFSDSRLIMRKYGRDDRLRFSDFIRMLEPQDVAYSQILQNKQSKKLSQASIISLKMLFELIQQIELHFSEVREYMKSQPFNLRDIFNMLSYDKQALTQQDLLDFFFTQNRQVQQVQLLLEKLDIDQDGVVSYADFAGIL